MTWTIVLMILVILAALWLVTGGLGRLLRLVGRKTGLDEEVDQAFEHEGELDPSDYLKFKERHRHNEHLHL